MSFWESNPKAHLQSLYTYFSGQDPKGTFDMNIFTVAFFGHRRIDDYFRLESLLYERIRRLLSEKGYVEFLVGRNGEFDQMASSAVLHMKKVYRSDNSALILVLPYMTADYRNNQKSYESYYDGIELSSASTFVYPKSAIQARNREMVDRANLILCYVNKESGGAYQTIQYAVRCGKRIENLAEKGANL